MAAVYLKSQTSVIDTVWSLHTLSINERAPLIFAMDANSAAILLFYNGRVTFEDRLNIV